jgi:hypothetical protein
LSFPPQAAFLSFGQGASVNHKRRVIIVTYKDDLQPTSTIATATNQPLVIFDFSGEWSASMLNYDFRLIGAYALLGDVLDIPLVPSEIHQAFLSLII